MFSGISLPGLIMRMLMLMNDSGFVDNLKDVVGGHDVFLDEFDALLVISIDGLVRTTNSMLMGYGLN